MNKEQTTTTAVAITDKPLGTVRNKKYRVFDVSNETFSRFQVGRTKYERWSKFINEDERDIVSYYNRNKNSVIVLRNSENGALRALYHTK
tara:strand:- start:203 stop:472 length:270 start_codon:yes stop_codon:yes gene_type:complete